MTFLLLNLLQARTRLSWVVIVAAALAFAGGVAIFVYFYRRYKRIEKETEEDWDSSRQSLFVTAPARAAKIEETEKPVEAEDEVAEEATVQRGGTRAFASDTNLSAFDSALAAEPEPVVEAARAPEPAIAAPPPEPEAAPAEPTPAEPRATEILASPLVELPVAQPEPETPFDEEIWEGLEIKEQPPVVTEPHVAFPSTEPLSAARVDQPAQRGRLEAPQKETAAQPVGHQPPSVAPIRPGDAAATRELRSPQSLAVEQPGSAEPAARGTSRLASAADDIARPVDPKHPEGETRALWDRMAVAGTTTEPEKPVPAGVASRGRSFGSILGLPAEPSHQPLILGEQVRPADETGIGALTHYGQDLGPKAGRAGTVALVIVVALLAGAAALYLFAPSVHSRVDGFIARLRGAQTQNVDALKPRAQIIPSSRPEVNKNLVTARGAVDNISDAPLEKLEVEISLQRGGDAPPEIRRIPVTPDSLPQGERGTFEFEYDGKRDTGFAGYTITRLFSNGAEVRFRTPAQK